MKDRIIDILQTYTHYEDDDYRGVSNIGLESIADDILKFIEEREEKAFEAGYYTGNPKFKDKGTFEDYKNSDEYEGD